MSRVMGDINNNPEFIPSVSQDDDSKMYMDITDRRPSNSSICDSVPSSRLPSPNDTNEESRPGSACDTSSLLLNFEDDDGEDIRVGVGDVDAYPASNIPTTAHRNRSIEIFFGSLTTFHTFYQMLCEKGVGSSTDGNSGRVMRVKPETIKKLVLVGHPVTSFSGLNLFARLVEAWITNCSVSEAKWADFMGLVHLHKLYIYNCQLNSLEPLYFQNLRVLWLSGNNLTSLSFLGQGLVCLNELNVARNDITCILEENLFKCVNLQRLNLSGNPICIFQDVQAVKVLPNLESLYLADPLYGKCPVANICDSRAMFLSFLSKITTLDGRKVTPAERAAVQEYVKSRCLYYYSNSVRGVTSHVALRKTMLSSANKQMEVIGARLLELAALAAKYRRTISSVEVVPIFTNAKNLMKDQLMKIENRMLKLKEWKEVSTRRLEVIMQISRWEQEVEKWMKWIEFQSYGNTQSRIAHSVHGSALADGGSLCSTIHELLSALACPGLWPQNILLKVETVMAIRDKGMEAGMERIYYDNFAYKDEPKFVPPPPDIIENKNQNLYSTLNPFMMSPTSPYCPPPPPTNPKPVTSYTTPDYRPPIPLFPFPESVPGLPERSQPIFMFLVCPQLYLSNPLHYLQKILMDKSRHFKDIRVTNCLWLACQNKPADGTYAVIIVVKVLEECLQPVNLDKRGCSVIMRHSWDCATFSVKRPLAVAPAYIVNVSFTYENKQPIWHKRSMDDEDVLLPAETALGSLRSKIQMHGHPPMTKPGRAKIQPHLKRIGDGFHADLASVQISASKEGTVELLDVNRHEKNREPFDLHHVSKLLGKDSTQYLTSLDLSGNRLGLIVGLENVGTLKKLNLSYNNLTTLSGLQKLPNLIELKVGWNSLRFLHSNISTLAYTTPRLMTLEILPNPFQDVRDMAHIPVLLHTALPLLNRVDIWSAPFTPPNPVVPLVPSQNNDGSFAHKAMEDVWVGNVHVYDDMASKCLTDLDLTNLPQEPPLPKDFNGAGIDLNLSDNYLTTSSLKDAPFCAQLTWKTHLVKLQLQENVIASMEWANGVVFPNCHILNLSINLIDEVDNIPSSFPNLRHLHLNGNPLPCDVNILSSFRSFSSLLTLDCTSTPLASHPDYASFIAKNISTLKMLDGAPTTAWEIADSTEKLGGNLSADWLEEKIGNRDWGSLQQLSLASSGLQKISLPPHALPKLLSLDLQDNAVTNLSILSSLPSLRVLCVSHNNVSALGGNPCPVCYSHTAQSQAAAAQKLRSSKSSTTGSTFYEWNGKATGGLPTSQSINKGTGFDSFGMPVAHQGHKVLPCHVKNDLRNTGAVAWGMNCSESPDSGSREHTSPPVTPLVPPPKRVISKPVFPKLEVLVMAHNGLTSLGDLHLHAMQNLQTIILNCNNLTHLQGLENLPCVRAIVLDHNRIRDIPFNSLSGCKSLKYLHLEHNRITSLPRLPHLTNLTSLYLAYNKIQSLTDLNALSGTSITELSMVGNPLATRSDYRLNVAARVPQLSVLDGKDLAGERIKLGELTNKWFPQSGRSTNNDYMNNNNSNNDSFVYRSLDKEGLQATSQSQQRPVNTFSGGDREFSLRIKPLSSHLANNSPRSLQYSSQKQKLRYGYNHQET